MERININNVDTVFNELKRNHLIDENLVLKESNAVFNFKKSFFGKKILYNPQFVNMEKDCLRFVFLHEQGHAKRFQYTHIAVISSALISFACYIFLFDRITNPLLVSLIIVTVFIMFFDIQIPLIQGDEYFADQYATRSLIRSYHKKGVHHTLSKALQTIRDKQRNLNFLGWILRMFYYLVPYHPACKDRVSRIIEFEKELSEKRKETNAEAN